MKRMVFLLAGLGFALPVSATPDVPVKCGANMERVWVYDNLTTLDVSARLKCGTTVDVLGLEKGYVKVRTADGNEGYVPAESIPASEVAELTAAAPPAPIATVTTFARSTAQPAAAPPAAAQPVVATPAAPPVPVRVVSAAPLVAARVSASAPPAPPANIVPPAAVPAPAIPAAQQSKPAPANVPVPAQAPAPVPSAPATSRVAASAPVSQHPIVLAAAPPASVSRVSSASSVVVETTAPRPVVAAMPVNATVHVNAAPAPREASRENATLTVEEIREPAPSAAPAATIVRAADYTMVTKGKMASATVRKADFSDDDEDLPEVAAPVEDLSACSVYFSAYGVTPMQDKWIAGDRPKKFPGVCPAPQPSMVDYVVIFTHDMDFFTTTLPDPIHTDRNGFSDWSPVTAADSTAIPVSSLDKAHREYAWVFRVHRGTFDPSHFTARRRPQFTKAESSAHASSKSIEDAMEFIAETGPSQ